MSETARCAELLTQGQTRWSIPLSPPLPKTALQAALAHAMLSGKPGLEEIVARCTRTLGRPWRWLRPLARRYLRTFQGGTRPRQREVTRFLRRDEGFTRAWRKHADKISIARGIPESQQMQPVAAAVSWTIPAIASVGALAVWLELELGDLEWFADLKGLTSKRPVANSKGMTLATVPLDHYIYRILRKRSGGVRVIESPKRRLKAIQRKILAGILDRIPVHPAVHGFVKGRSIRSFAAPHVSQRVVLRMDLRDYFPTFGGCRVQAFFRTAGYPERVADLLGGICTNAVPQGVWSGMVSEIHRQSLSEGRRLYSRPHLPQGAPTSPALSNLMTYKADCRLDGLARSVGAVYTRYADDLAFSGSGKLESNAERFVMYAAAILKEEGFSTNLRKTDVMRRGARQQLAGVVVNEHINVARSEFDRLKATLANCVRFGAESQNRENHPRFREHLEGRVGFVESMAQVRGAKLRTILDRIDWSAVGIISRENS